MSNDQNRKDKESISPFDRFRKAVGAVSTVVTVVSWVYDGVQKLQTPKNTNGNNR